MAVVHHVHWTLSAIYVCAASPILIVAVTWAFLTRTRP